MVQSSLVALLPCCLIALVPPCLVALLPYCLVPPYAQHNHANIHTLYTYRVTIVRNLETTLPELEDYVPASFNLPTYLFNDFVGECFSGVRYDGWVGRFTSLSRPRNRLMRTDGVDREKRRSKAGSLLIGSRRIVSRPQGPRRPMLDRGISRAIEI